MLRIRFLVGVGLLAGAALAMADAQVPAPSAPGPAAEPDGATLFRMNCAVCHGTSATGDGPMAASLRYQPADLTVIARHHGGEFPADKVHRIIDGRQPVKGHGGSDMPVWGDAFKNVRDGYSEKSVERRIRALVEYLRSIQVPRAGRQASLRWP